MPSEGGWTFAKPVVSRLSVHVGQLVQPGQPIAEFVPTATYVVANFKETPIARIKAGPDAPGWSEGDKALLQATDELTSDAFITDATWAALSGLNEKQRMDLVMTVGQYTQVSMMLNSFGIQLDDDLTLDPDLAR